MIPKLIHQTAKDAAIPEKWRLLQSKVRGLHPDWTYHLWTDNENLDFVQLHFPDFLSTYNSFPKHIMRVDVIRYLILYKLGGVYLDMDYEMLRPFDLLQYGLVMPLEKLPYSEAPFGQTCNCFMAAEPGHPFFKAVIDDLQKNPPLDPAGDPVITTGPLFLTRIYGSSPEVRTNATAPAPSLFNPTIPKTRRMYEGLLQQPELYGIHHCHGSWRDFSWMWHLRSRVKRIYRRLVDG